MALRALATVFAIGILAGLPASAIGARAFQPQSLVLQPGDVPANLKLAASATFTNAEIASAYHFTPKQLAAWGRLSGYKTEFGLNHRPTQHDSGVLAIRSTTSICRTSAGAHVYFLYGRDVVPARYRITPPAKLGDESVMATDNEVDQGLKLVIYSIGWRHGPILASVVVSGNRGRLKPAQAIALARTQERKIAASVP